MSETTTDERMAYVGYCPRCDLMYAAAVDSPKRKRDNAKFVAQLIRDGARVDRVTPEAVRAAKWCDGHSALRAANAKQAELLLSGARA